MINNIGAYFEIPVVNMQRAIDFYQNLFGIEFERGSIHDNEMAFFPHQNNGIGISGALVKGDVLSCNQHLHRSDSGTPARASSMCSPQPSQVGFPHLKQLTLEHITIYLHDMSI